MKPNKAKSASKKVANVLIVALVLGGTTVFWIVNNAGGGLTSKLFLAFFGVIITIQVIPGLLLIGSMLKGVIGLAGKKEAHANATFQNNDSK